MKIRRDIASIPERSASETWKAVIKLVGDNSSISQDELNDAASVMADVISEEHPDEHPIIFSGCGPQLRIYLDYAQDALERGLEIDDLNWSPTECDSWQVSVPTDSDDLSWVNSFFAKHAPRFKAYDKKSGAPQKESQSSVKSSGIEIDWSKVNL